MSVSEKITAIQTNRDQLREKSITMALSTGDSIINDQSKLADITLAITRIPVQKSESGGAISKGVKPGQSVTLPAGYYPNASTVSATTDVPEAEKIYKLQSKTVTPSGSQQTVTPQADDPSTPEIDYYGLSSVVVKAVPDKEISKTLGTDVSFAAGTVLLFDKATDTDGKWASRVYLTIPEGVTNVSITFNELDGTIRATAVKSDEVYFCDQLLSGKKAIVAYNADGDQTKPVVGVLAQGSMPEGKNISFNALSQTSVSIPSGHYSGKTVSLTADLETELAGI